MAAPGVRARNFLQPTPGGASAIFARQRGMMVAPAAVAASVTQEDPRVRESRFGKATGRDYANFLGKNGNVIKGAVNSLKNLLVGTFIAAKSLGATLKGVIKQIKGMSGGGGGGGGIFKTLGIIGLVGAIIAGVAAIFGPQIKKAFEFLKGGAEGIFQSLKKRLGEIDENIGRFYEKIRDYINNKITPIINLINKVVASVKNLANEIFHLPSSVNIPLIGNVPLPFMGKIKGKAKEVYGHLNNFGTIDLPPKLPPYKDILDGDGNIVEKGLLGSSGLNFLAPYNDVGSLGGAMMTGAGNLAMGGIENTTGFFGDIINNLIASLGLTGQANSASNFLGMGNLFGQSRQLGSGPGIPSLMNQGGGTTSGNYAPGAGGFTPQQRAFLETVSFAEGTQNPESYNTWFGGMKFPPEQPDLSKYTINQIIALQKRFLREGHGKFAGGTDASAAVGKYQMTHPETYAAKAGLNPAVDKFTPENQDKMALYGYIMDQGGVTEAEINAPEISDHTIDKLAPVFASYPNLFGPGDKGRAPGDGVSYYGGQGAKMKSQIKERYRNEHSAAMQNAQPAPPAQSTTSPPPSTKTNQSNIPPAPPILPPPLHSVNPVPSTKKVPKKSTPVSFINLPMQGQAKPMVASRPSPTQSPRNPGGGGSPNIPHPPSTHPDDLNIFELGIYT